MSLTTLLALGALGARSAAADILGDEQAFLAKINALRSSLGLGSLALDAQLSTVARNWSQQMANAGNISHNPDLKDQVTANWSKLGENVGMGPKLDDLFTAFVNSPHHYANLVDPSFEYVGVGVVISGGTIYTTHDFMSLRGATSRVTAPVTTPTTHRVTSTPAPAVTGPTVPTATTTTSVPPPPPPPPPLPAVPERIRMSLRVLQWFFDPA